ncbi:MAG: hypothetical protein R3C56_30255 [Pirellulaceae bacterium]
MTISLANSYGQVTVRKRFTRDGSDRGLDFRGEPMGAAILSIHDFGGVAFVVLNDGIHGGELWRNDGTEAGTRIVKDINPGQLSNDLYDEGVVLGGQFIFPPDNGTGGELWRPMAPKREQR